MQIPAVMLVVGPSQHILHCARAIHDALREAVERRILVPVVDPDDIDADAAGRPVAHAFRHELLREVEARTGVKAIVYASPHFWHSEE